VDGIEPRGIEGVRVQVHGAAKTVADCFQYRQENGIDDAIEGLPDVLRSRKATLIQINRFAKVCWVVKGMQPYLESAE
jgi:predicted transcriptional regulator of viral defense system